MSKIGIIAEFNPFHNGHCYFLKKVKEKFPDSFVTLVLSTCFTERGEFSFLTKWEKTKLSLAFGIDLVIELPFFFGTQSADIFSTSAITLLENLDIDYLIFGSETNDVDVLKNLASTILYHKDYNKLVKEYLSLGNSYPSSNAKALYNLTGVNLINSNDILGVTYIKTILENNYHIKPITIKRTNSYLAKNTTGSISSATSIRELYLKDIDIKNFIPAKTYNILNFPKNYQETFFTILKYKLISEINTLDIYLDVSEGIEKKIKKVILKVNSYQELIENLKSKRWTYNKLNRMFLHILMNIKKDDDYNLNYIRVLGFNTKGKNYLKVIKSKTKMPIITNYKDIDDPLLKLELKTTILYLTIINKPYLIKEELKSIPIRVD